MASKKEPKARAKEAGIGKDDTSQAKSACQEPGAVKVRRKATAKSTDKSEVKRDSAKHHKMRNPVALGKKNVGGGKKNAGSEKSAIGKKSVAT